MGYLDLNGLQKVKAHIENLLFGKVDKEDGKGLSSNDFTNEDKEKLDSLKGADWNTNDENDPAYIKNRTHWEEVEKVLTVENCQVSNSMYGNYTTSKLKLNEYLDNNFICVIDGVEEYIEGPVKVSSFSGNISGDSYKGTRYSITTSIGSIREGYREFSSGKKDWLVDMSTSKVGSWSISLYALNSTIHQLNEKFIPSTIARVDELPIAITSDRIDEICGIEPVMTLVVDEDGDAIINAGFPDDEGNLTI